MKITKLLSSSLNTFDIHGIKFQISDSWKYAAISESGTLILFHEKPKLIDNLWFSMDAECFLAEVEYDGNFRTSLIKLKEE